MSLFLSTSNFFKHLYWNRIKASPLLLLQTSNDPLQLSSFLPLHSLEDLGRTLGLTAGGAFPSQRLTVLQDEGVLVVPVENNKSSTISYTSKHFVLQHLPKIKNNTQNALIVPLEPFSAKSTHSTVEVMSEPDRNTDETAASSQ